MNESYSWLHETLDEIRDGKNSALACYKEIKRTKEHLSYTLRMRNNYKQLYDIIKKTASIFQDLQSIEEHVGRREYPRSISLINNLSTDNFPFPQRISLFIDEQVRQKKKLIRESARSDLKSMILAFEPLQYRRMLVGYVLWFQCIHIHMHVANHFV